MAWGDKHKRSVDTHNVGTNPVPVDHTTTAVLENATTEAYPGFIPQRYIRPVQAPSDEGHRSGGVNRYAENNIDRGTEDHGVDVDSHVHAKDDGKSGFEAHGHNHSGISDSVAQILPDDEDILDEEYPVPVRIVRDEPIEDVRSVIDSYIVIAGAGLTPVRVLGRDRKRTKAIIGTVGTVTGNAVVVSGVNGNPAYGFPLGGALTQPLITAATDELWVSGQTASDTFTVAVFIERTTNADPHQHN